MFKGRLNIREHTNFNVLSEFLIMHSLTPCEFKFIKTRYNPVYHLIKIKLIKKRIN